LSAVVADCTRIAGEPLFSLVVGGDDGADFPGPPAAPEPADASEEETVLAR
jgi:hypothetical protein